MNIILPKEVRSRFRHPNVKRIQGPPARFPNTGWQVCFKRLDWETKFFRDADYEGARGSFHAACAYADERRLEIPAPMKPYDVARHRINPNTHPARIHYHLSFCTGQQVTDNIDKVTCHRCLTRIGDIRHRGQDPTLEQSW